MNTLDDLRAEWIEVRRSLGRHIAHLEAGNPIHPIGQDPDKATAELLIRLKQYRAEVESWLGVERLGHAGAPHGALHHELLAGGEVAAEREHHDAGEAGADDEHPAL